MTKQKNLDQKKKKERRTITHVKETSCLLNKKMASIVSSTNDENNSFSNLPEKLSATLNANGYVVIDNSIDNLFLHSLIQDAIDIEKYMKVGEISTGLTKDLGKRKSRGDKIVWLPSIAKQKNHNGEKVENETSLKTTPKHLFQLQNKFENLRKTLLNKYLLENDNHQTDYCSYMLAMYPGDGHGYVKHKDSTGKQPGRKLTTICYLNNDYKKEHGGSLKLWPRCKNTDSKKKEEENQPITIDPIGGRLVIFHSDLWHEVLPSYHRRIACTAWLVNREDLKNEIMQEERDEQLANMMKRIALRKLANGRKKMKEKARNNDQEKQQSDRLILTYLDSKGTAECTRIVLRYGNVEFTDKRISYEEIQKMREEKKLPTGQVPLLEIIRNDGEKKIYTKINQSQAILRYCGKLTNMYPVNDFLLAARCDMVLNALDDIKTKLCPLWYGHAMGRSPRNGAKLIPLTKTQNMEVVTLLNNEVLPIQFERLENILNESDSPFFCGKNMFICDIEMYMVVSGLLNGTYAGSEILPTVLEKCVKLKKLARRVKLLVEL